MLDGGLLYWVALRLMAARPGSFVGLWLAVGSVFKFFLKGGGWAKTRFTICSDSELLNWVAMRIMAAKPGSFIGI
jgi:hypothetical protein